MLIKIGTSYAFLSAVGEYHSWLAAGRGTPALVAALAARLLGLLAGAVALHAIEDIRRHRQRLELWASVPGKSRAVVAYP